MDRDFNSGDNTSVSSPNPGLPEKECPEDAEIVGLLSTGINFTAVEDVRHPFDKLDYPDDALIVTRLPTDSSHGPSTELVLYASVKRKILNTPGFPECPTGLLPNSCPYVIKDTAEVADCVPTGLGMFATRDLNFGDLILTERPLIVVPEKIDLSRLPRFRQEMKAGVSDSLFEQVLQFVSGRDEEKKKAYMKLANCYQDSQFTMVGIRDTNSYRIPQFQHTIGTNDINYSGVMEDMSRINHSCAPNAMRSFDVSSLTFSVYAARFIKGGQQILLNYHGSYSCPYSSRKSYLRPYNIDCSCCICSLSPTDLAICDGFRTSLYKRIDRLENKVMDILDSAPANSTNVLPTFIDEANALIRDMEKYGMEASRAYERAVNILSAAYSTMMVSDSSFSERAASTFKKCATLRRIHKSS